MSDDFRERLISLGQRAVTVAPNCTNEESSKMFLVLPFIALLGYDPLNHHEVFPEHHADFSEKYKNKVDYALFKKGVPIIAIECKSVGASTKDDRGQLKSYFNAAKSVKMSILTDGLTWEFYADSDAPNLMDDHPFLVIDLRHIATGKVDDLTVEGLRALTKQQFDADNIGAKAREKHIFNSVLREIVKQSREPTAELCRLLLKSAKLTHVHGNKLKLYRPIIQNSFREFINQQILMRLDISEKVVEKVSAPVAESPPPPPVEPAGDPKIVTTDNELAVYAWVQKRLAFLVEDDKLFAEIEHLQYKDYQGKFAIYYKQVNKGRLFDYIERRSGAEGPAHRFVLPDDIKLPEHEVITDKLTDVDTPLLTVFKARVRGVSSN